MTFVYLLCHLTTVLCGVDKASLTKMVHLRKVNGKYKYMLISSGARCLGQIVQINDVVS